MLLKKASPIAFSLRSFANRRSCRLLSTAISAAPVEGSDDAHARLRPFNEMPTAGGNSFFGMGRRLIDMKLDQYELHRELAAEHGRLYRMKTGPWKYMVVVTDPELGEVVARNEGKYPDRGPSSALSRAVFQKARRDSRLLGLSHSNGTEWRTLRSEMNPVSTPRKLVPHVDKLDPVNQRFLDMIQESVGPDGYTQDLRSFAPHWTIEGMARFVYPSSVSIQTSRDTRINDIVEGTKAIINALKYSNFPVWLVKILPIPELRRVKTSSDKMISALSSLMEESTLKASNSSATTVSNKDMEKGSSFVEQWKEQGFSDADIKALAYDFISAAADLTATTTMYILHKLAQYPEAQVKAHSEVVSLVGKDGVITAEALQNMPYIKAIQKETTRFASPFSAIKVRTIENEISLGGYHIPANTFIGVLNPIMVMDPSIFKDPKAYRPERWLKGEESTNDSETKKAQVMSTAIFGYGPRACIGRRVAELMMWSLTAKMVQRNKFELHPDSKNMRALGAIGMRPDRAIRLSLTPRD